MPVKISEIIYFLNERLIKKIEVRNNAQDRKVSIPSELTYFAEWPNSWQPKFSFWSDLDTLIQNRKKMQITNILP